MNTSMLSESLIGPVPSDWTQTTLGNACALGGGDVQTGPFGSQLHASDYIPCGVPVVMPQDIGDNRLLVKNIARIDESDAARLSRHRLRIGDIVYSRRGDVKRRALIRKDNEGWLCGTGCLRVQFGHGPVDPLWASYYLGHPAVQEWVSQHAIGATMPNLNTQILSSVPFVLPPGPIQRSVGGFLSTLDDKIDLNRQTNQTLEHIAATLFKSWFVDFDPVRAKAEGHQPEGMDAETAALFPDRLVESEVGKIPEGWEVGTFANVACSARDSVNPSATPAEPFSHYSLPAFDAGRMPLVESGADIKSNKLLVPDDAVLISKLNPHIPRVWLPFDANGFRRVASTEFVVAQPLESPHRPFLYAMASSPEFIQRLQSMVTGTTGSHQRVPPSSLLALPLVLPPTELIDAYSNLARPIYQRVHANLEESATLARLRDTLLPRLLSGELRVPTDLLHEESTAILEPTADRLIQSAF